MKKALGFLWKEKMLLLSLLAAIIAMIITPPTAQLISDIDWRTLGTLLMMLCVLEGFKQENVLRPLETLVEEAGTYDVAVVVSDIRSLFYVDVCD